jgi:polyphosphate kinase
MHLLTLQLADNTKAREQDQYGEYHYCVKQEGRLEIDSQTALVMETNYITEEVAE